MGTRPFFDTLREIRRGEILDDCGAELARCVRSVDETGKPAKLSIELTIKPAAKVAGTYVISDRIRRRAKRSCTARPKATCRPVTRAKRKLSSRLWPTTSRRPASCARSADLILPPP